MSNLWERFDGIASADEVAKEKSKFTPIEAGNYEMLLEKIEPSESKQGLPMVKGQFRIVDGNRVVFYNQMLQNLNNPDMTAVNIAQAVKFIGDIIGEDIEFTGLSALADIISGIEVGGTYKINVSYGKKDTDMTFPQLKVVKDYIVPTTDDDDIPF